MTLPRKQMFCQNLAVIWARKQLLPARMRYQKVTLLPGGPGANPGKWRQIYSANWKYTHQALLNRCWGLTCKQGYSKITTEMVKPLRGLL
ncbi:hypothetical protein HZ326_20426 [Fusarium oxysporum f. sp. albedinis]|nr:hypothetical protein HZ326_20426 [Fusarium oxysporum f. sp. albedinis]